MIEILEKVLAFMAKNNLSLNNTPNTLPDFLHPMKIKIGNGLWDIILVEIRQHLTDNLFHIDIQYGNDEDRVIAEKLSEILNGMPYITAKIYKVNYMNIFYSS